MQWSSTKKWGLFTQSSATSFKSFRYQGFPFAKKTRHWQHLSKSRVSVWNALTREPSINDVKGRGCGRCKKLMALNFLTGAPIFFIIDTKFTKNLLDFLFLKNHWFLWKIVTPLAVFRSQPWPFRVPRFQKKLGTILVEKLTKLSKGLASSHWHQNCWLATASKLPLLKKISPPKNVKKN